MLLKLQLIQFLVSHLLSKPTRTQIKLTSELVHTELKKENHSFSQLLELQKKESLKIILLTKNIFQSMVINFSTPELDKFFLDGTTQMLKAEELQQLKLCQEQVLSESLVISYLNTDQLHFTSHHQHGVTIIPFLLRVDSK